MRCNLVFDNYRDFLTHQQLDFKHNLSNSTEWIEIDDIQLPVEDANEIAREEQAEIDARADLGPYLERVECEGGH